MGATLTCASGNTVCALGCSMDRCETFTPSNAIDPTLVQQVAAPITFFGNVVINTDTGAISGGYTRTAGEGFHDGIVFVKGAIGVFVFAALDVSGGATVTFNGMAAGAFLVGGDAMIAGTIDGSGGCSQDAGCPGPGAGFGAIAPTMPGGCGPGATGVTSAADNSDTGGGGGAGATAGGAGGGAGSTFAGGMGGAPCLTATLEPLVGGSGGGGGGAGMTTAARGGGGGGALQITAFGTLAVSGTITMGGGGGEGGFSDGSAAADGGAGAGGGAGGGILLEAGTVSLAQTSHLAANGGGGGGGAAGPSPGAHGASGGTTTVAAPGGTATAPGTTGGNGAAGTSAAGAAPDAGLTDNGGGGGGGAGAIYLRGASPPQLVGAQSPPAGTGVVH